MPRDIFTIGPVLSICRLSAHGHWQVTALIGITSDAPVILQVDGRVCGTPMLLLTHNKQQFLRYDLSCPMQS